MKKVLLLTLVLGFTVSLMSQNEAYTPQQYKYSVEVDHADEHISDMGTNTSSNLMPMSNNRLSIEDTQIGHTQYDLQSNSALQNRFYRYPDGSMAHVWTMGLDGAPGFSDRGTGYTYFDGSAWADMPTERVEDERVGWPSYAPLGDGEIVVAHTGATGIKISKRDTRFSGAWDYSVFEGPAEVPGLTWPRMTTSGESNSTVHLVANSYDPYEGQESALLYSRSTDGGETWADENVILDGMGSDYYTEINADDYILASRGNTVAIVVSSAWHDLFLMKSEDNGETWNKTVVWEHPYPMFDWETTITTDTIWSPDGSLTADIDSEGNVHLAFGLTRVIHEEAGTSYNYFPFTDGIIYWNETMEPFENAANQHYALKYENIPDESYAAFTPDIDNNGTIDITQDELFIYRTLGMATMPSLKLDADGDVALAYTVPREDLFSGVYYYRHVYGAEKIGATWSAGFDVTGGELHLFDECIYPQLANILPGDEYLYITYQKDNTPGLALDEDHDWVDNQVIATKVSMDEFGVISNESGINVASENVVSQNYPNPFNATAIVDVEIAEGANLSMEVVNLVGQTVQRVDKGYLPAGKHTLEISGTNLETGVYFYNVNINDETITKKMVVK